MKWNNIKDKLPPYNTIVLAVWSIQISEYQEATTDCRLLIRFKSMDTNRDNWRYCNLKVTPIVGWCSITTGDFPPETMYWKHMDASFPVKLFKPESISIDNRFELLDL